MSNSSSELIYELNLPPADQIFLESFAGFTNSYELRRDIDRILKPQWLKFNHVAWDHLYYFYKQDAGHIHSDLPQSWHPYNRLPLLCPWGINWIWGGDSLVEFWNFEDTAIYKSLHIRDAQDKIIASPKVMHGLAPPFKTYRLINNRCYLIFNKLPHRFTGIGPRSALSLRPPGIFDDQRKILQNFQQYLCVPALD